MPARIYYQFYENSVANIQMFQQRRLSFFCRSCNCFVEFSSLTLQLNFAFKCQRKKSKSMCGSLVKTCSNNHPGPLEGFICWNSCVIDCLNHIVLKNSNAG